MVRPCCNIIRGLTGVLVPLRKKQPHAMMKTSMAAVVLLLSLICIFNPYPKPEAERLPPLPRQQQDLPLTAFQAFAAVILPVRLAVQRKRLYEDITVC